MFFPRFGCWFDLNQARHVWTRGGDISLQEAAEHRHPVGLGSITPEIQTNLIQKKTKTY